MTERQPPREAGRPAAGAAPAAEPVPADEPVPTGISPASEMPAGRIRMVAPLAGDDEAEGGDPVCWAYLVCDECGAITTEGHREGCSAGAAR